MELAIACVLQLKERLHTSTCYTLLLATACYYLLLATCHSPLATYHLQERFLHAQMPLLLDALRPLCWSTVSVEAALQCVPRRA